LARANPCVTDFGTRHQRSEADARSFASEVLVASFGADRSQLTAVLPLHAIGLPVAECPPNIWPPAHVSWWGISCHGGDRAAKLSGATGCGRDSLQDRPALSSGASSKVAPPSCDARRGCEGVSPGRDKLLVKVGQRPAIPFHTVLTRADSQLNNTNRRRDMAETHL
jgi:hypothetical protein